MCTSVQISPVFKQYNKAFQRTFTIQIISTMTDGFVKLQDRPTNCCEKKSTFCPGKSRENVLNIFQDLKQNSRIFQDSKKNPGLFQDVATLVEGDLDSKK